MLKVLIPLLAVQQLLFVMQFEVGKQPKIDEFWGWGS